MILKYNFEISDLPESTSEVALPAVGRERRGLFLSLPNRDSLEPSRSAGAKETRSALPTADCTTCTTMKDLEL